ncbi:MAG: hypothetical protein PHR25_01660 [Clostridia bacterium]|nr:hypothetical protein [Clostridia bacterium]MDD4375469.1 hypothetical protein [Clostridia bacterium]
MEENKKKILLGLLVFALIIITTLVIIIFAIDSKSKREQEKVNVQNSSNQTKDVLDETENDADKVNAVEEEKGKENERNVSEDKSKEVLEAAQKAEREAKEEKAKAEAQAEELRKKADELAELAKKAAAERAMNAKSYVERTEAGHVMEEYVSTGRSYFAFWLSSTNNIAKIKITFHEEFGEVVKIKEYDLRGHYLDEKAYKEISKDQISLTKEFQYTYSGDIAYVTIVITYNNGETRSNNFYYADNAVG